MGVFFCKNLLYKFLYERGILSSIFLSLINGTRVSIDTLGLIGCFGFIDFSPVSVFNPKPVSNAFVVFKLAADAFPCRKYSGISSNSFSASFNTFSFDNSYGEIKSSIGLVSIFQSCLFHCDLTIV